MDVTKGISSIAPVYYALGNHEINYMEAQGNELLDELTAAGAIILELESQDIEVNGQKLRIGGMFDYAFALDGNDSTIPECIFRKNCASVPEERSAIPLETEQRSAS